MNSNAYNQYRLVQAQTASRTQVVVMLLEGVVRFSGAAEQAATAHNVEGRHDALIKAQTIVAELLGSLDFERGGEVAVNLGRVYDYLFRRLVEANVKADVTIIAEVRELVGDLLPAWREIAQREGTETPTPRLHSIAV